MIEVVVEVETRSRDEPRGGIREDVDNPEDDETKELEVVEVETYVHVEVVAEKVQVVVEFIDPDSENSETSKTRVRGYPEPEIPKLKEPCSGARSERSQEQFDEAFLR